MKICFVCCEYPPAPHGAIGASVRSIGQALAQRGHEVRVVGLYPPHRARPFYSEDEGVRVWRLAQPPERLAWIPARYGLFRFVSYWARQGEIDLVEVPDWQGMAAGWPALPVPVVVRLYGSPAVAKGGRGLPLSARMLEGQSFHRANFCTAAASAIAGQSQAVHGPHRGGARVLQDFAEPLDLLGGVPRDPGCIVFAGSFTHHKGLDAVLDAWPRIAAQHGGARLHLFEQGTSGAARPQLDVRARLARMNGAARARVRTHPARESGALRDVFARARVAALPSRSGVFGMAPLEAMAAGCPVVHSRAANGLELIVNGRNGFLVDPEDPVQLAQACLLLLEDDALAARLGGAARRTVLETFSRSALAAQHEAFYEEAIEEFHQIGRGGWREALHAAR